MRLRVIDHFALWSDLPIVTIDIETTGFSPVYGDRIVELAAVRVERMETKGTWSHEIVGQFHHYLNPGRRIPAQASNVHHIYDEDVALAPRFRDIGAAFSKFCEGAVPCAFNQGFDSGFITTEMGSNGFDLLSAPVGDWPRWLDPLVWVRSADRFVVDDTGQRLSCALAAACGRRGITVKGAHGALGDAMATAELIVAMIPEIPHGTISEILRRQSFLNNTHARRTNR